MTNLKSWLFLLALVGLAVIFGLQPLAGVSGQAPSAPQVRYPLKNDLSPALRDLPARLSAGDVSTPADVQPIRRSGQAVPMLSGDDRLDITRPAWQDWAAAIKMPAPIFSFEGISNDDNFSLYNYYVIPPDPNGDIGLNHYVQWVNLAFAVWEVDRTARTATLVYGPAAGNTLWSGFGGLCETRNNGDPITLYDTQADRWVMSQLAFDNTLPEYHQCIAVSQSGDPTGAWYRYDYLISTEKLNDYPKVGIWPDAYYLTFNHFTATAWAGQGVAALDREEMLHGGPAAMVYFDLYTLDPNLGGMLPADLDGSTLPPPGAPGYFAQFDDDVQGYSPDQLQVWQFHVDWADPTASTFTPAAIINLADAGLAVDSELCDGYFTQCIDQPAPDIRLASLSDRLMYRLAYRNFGAYAALVVNHTVDVDGNGLAGIRWYELRVTDGLPGLYQAGTFAPTADHRWMGSLAMDHAGNMALGYSISSKDLYPSIRYAGRLAGDPLGVLAQGEMSLVEGGGSQTSYGARWGDYSMMAIDPLDDCTFWYIQEYYPFTDLNRWHTRIGVFRFPTCTTGPQGGLSGRVTDAVSGSPVSRVIVTLGETATLTDGTGNYRFLAIPPGTYALSGEAYGYEPGSAGEVSILEGESSMVDFSLTPLAAAEVSLSVRDGSGHGWPLYARVDIAAEGYSASVLTNPLTGDEAVSLFQGVPYTFTVNAVSRGYNPLVERAFVPQSTGERMASTIPFSLTANILACEAPGYRPDYVYFEDFEGDDGDYIPSAYVPYATSSWAWGLPVSGPGYAYSGEYVWATNLTGNYQPKENSALTSPAIDLITYAGHPLVLSWWQWLNTETYLDFASVEASVDGGETWQRVYGEIGGSVSIGWQARRIFLEPYFAVRDFRVRFRLHTAFGTPANAPGFYIDDIGIGAFEIYGTEVYQQDFEASGGGYTVGGVTSWEWGVPVSGPGVAFSGQNVWATNLAGDYGNNEDGTLTVPPIDLSAFTGRPPMLMWYQWLDSESGYDFPTIEVSRDNGQTWQAFYSEVSGVIDNTWRLHRLVLDPAYAVRGFQFRFRFTSDLGATAPGWYLDNVNIFMLGSLPEAVCANQVGGLVVGNINSLEGYPLPGASVSSELSPAVRSGGFSDPGVPASFYILFAPAGEQSVTAGWGNLASVQDVTVIADGVIGQDILLPAWLRWLPGVVK